MGSTAFDACMCGSGLPFARCHGDPANEFARVAALREAEAIPALFPFVRAEGTAIDAFLEQVAAETVDDLVVDEDVLTEGVALLDARERRRLVDSWAAPYADRWASLTRAASDAAAAENALLIGALRVAVDERSPTPHEIVALLENGQLRRSPFAALAFVIPPMFVWSRDEANAASAAASGRRKPAQQHKAIEDVAYALATFDHLRRTRGLVARLAAELPFEGLPVASGTLAGPCREVEVDDGSARTATVALLIAYVEEIAFGRRRSSL
jgi:hypothetical protein